MVAYKNQPIGSPLGEGPDSSYFIFFLEGNYLLCAISKLSINVLLLREVVAHGDSTVFGP